MMRRRMDRLRAFEVFAGSRPTLWRVFATEAFAWQNSTRLRISQHAIASIPVFSETFVETGG